MNAQELQNALANFSGSDQFHRHYTRRFLYTDGVQFLAENAANGAYWLLDIIASYQPTVMKNPRLADFQLWVLIVTENAAVVTCSEDSDVKPAVTQRIEYTDFPIQGEFKLYLENGTLLLPGER